MQTVVGPKWWDREFDDQGRSIRSDVRLAAHEIWDKACRRTIAVLGDEAEAAELMESTVMRVSEFLDRKADPAQTDKVPGLLMVSFCRELNRLAARLRRLETAGSAIDLEGEKEDWSWWEKVGRELDKEKILAKLSLTHRHIWFLRDQGYDWSEIARRMQTSAASLKSGYWRALQKAFPEIRQQQTAPLGLR
jgi:DNA-directed RNA polymerase specialized sigma24 family protein